MDYEIVAPCLDGRKGGLLLVWKKEVRIYSRASTLDFIDVSVEEENGDMWRLTGIYGDRAGKIRIVRTNCCGTFMRNPGYHGLL